MLFVLLILFSFNFILQVRTKSFIRVWNIIEDLLESWFQTCRVFAGIRLCYPKSPKGTLEVTEHADNMPD